MVAYLLPGGTLLKYNLACKGYTNVQISQLTATLHCATVGNRKQVYNGQTIAVTLP